MCHPDHPDGDYQAANKVQVFDLPPAIGWLTGYETDDGRLEFGGWTLRWLAGSGDEQASAKLCRVEFDEVAVAFSPPT